MKHNSRSQSKVRSPLASFGGTGLSRVSQPRGPPCAMLPHGSIPVAPLFPQRFYACAVTYVESLVVMYDMCRLRRPDAIYTVCSPKSRYGPAALRTTVAV